MFHEKYIARCIELAAQGVGKVAPNPLVGAVIVYKDSIIGEGYHQVYGGSHAEVNAIHSVQDQSLLPLSTLYVNLEPCSHHGKTPPCTDLIIEKKIKQVVIGAKDPFPKVAGKGIERLRMAGIVVLEPVLEQECKALNKHFYTFYVFNRPYIILKWAESKDGFIAPANQKNKQPFKISNAEAQYMVHHWRSEIQAILVGKETVLKDDPLLNVRLVTGKDPIPFILGSANEIPADYRILQSNPVFFENSGNTQQKLTQYCLEHTIQSILVEGGAQTLNYFIENNFWDEARIITNDELQLGDGVLAPQLHRKPTGIAQVGHHNSLQIIFNPTHNG